MVVLGETKGRAVGGGRWGVGGGGWVGGGGTGGREGINGWLANNFCLGVGTHTESTTCK